MRARVDMDDRSRRLSASQAKSGRLNCSPPGSRMKSLTKKRVDRRLMAILAADVAGYSRLMGSDEEGTLAQLKLHRRDLTDRSIRKHRGLIIKTTGDGMLVEFASAVEAVRCAA